MTSDSGKPLTVRPSTTSVPTECTDAKDTVPLTGTSAVLKDEPPSKLKDDVLDESKSKKSKVEEEEEVKEEEIVAGCVDMETYQQILDLDEEGDDSREFSREMAWQFFAQAGETFGVLEKALEDKDLVVLKDKGHFLKGSSATLGVSKVQEICEQIQNAAKDAEEKTITDDEALKLISKALPIGKKECEIADKWLKDWYRANAEFDEE